MNTLSNIQINNYLKNIKNFDGCIMSDEGKKIKNNKFYIVNLNNSYQKGSHWCALYKDKNKSYYFDSYGFYPDKEIEPYITPYEYNKYQIQSLYSSSCGYFCIAFVLYMSLNNNNIYNFINMFSKKNFDINENILYNYIKNKHQLITHHYLNQ